VPTTTLTWRIMDNAACPICKAINGYTWVIDGPFPNELVHPVYGLVWNVALGSEAHKHGQAAVFGVKGACRCHMDITYDLSDLLLEARRLRDEVTLAMKSGGLTMGQRDLTETEGDVLE